MLTIRHKVMMYKTVWWGLQSQGRFNGIGNGASSYEQKNVSVVCADYLKTTFRMVVESTGTTLSGKKSGAWAYQMSDKLPCGTNP